MRRDRACSAAGRRRGRRACARAAPRIRPSASSASSTDARCPRPCGADRKFSRRSSTHLTGRPSSSAASATSGVSTGSVPLEPNAAADVRDDHADRALVAGRGICASCARGRCALCDDDQTVSRSPSRRGERAARSPSASPPGAGSRARCARRGRRAANAPATSPARFSQRTSVAPARGSTTGRQRLVVDLDALGRVLGLRARLAPRRPRPAGRRSAPRRPPAAGCGASATVKPGRRVDARRHGAARRCPPPSTARPRTPRAPARGRAGCARTPCAACPSQPDVVEELASVRTGSARPRDGGPAGRSTPRRPRLRGYLWKAAARSEASAVPPPRRRADRVSRGRDRTAARAAALARASPTASASRSSTSSRTATASCCPTCRCTATSEDRPHHPYSPEWLTEVLAGFLHDTCGPRPLVAGHGVGAQLALRAIARRRAHARRSSSCCRTRCTPSPRAAGWSRRARRSCAPRSCPGVRPRARPRGRARPAARAAATS